MCNPGLIIFLGIFSAIGFPLICLIIRIIFKCWGGMGTGPRIEKFESKPGDFVHDAYVPPKESKHPDIFDQAIAYKIVDTIWES